MKKLIFFGVLSALSMSKDIHGAESMDDNGQSYGNQKYGKKTVDSIQANGAVFLKETKVLGIVSVNGSLSAEESAINCLQVNGQAVLNNCLVEQSAVVNGSLDAQNTQFQNDLSIASQKIVLRMCSVNSLTIREVSGYAGMQIIDLRSGTTVTGSIVVESGKGQILVSSNSKISELQVSGAVIIRK